MPEPREILGSPLFIRIQQISRRKDVPEAVIDEVFAIKQITDRVDGRIQDDTICLVLINNGYSATDNLYGFERDKQEKVITEMDANSIKGAEKLTSPVAEEAKIEDVKPPAEKTAEVTETEKVEDTPATISDVDEGPQPLANETVVTFIHEGGYVDGVIKTSQVNDEDIFYEIEVDEIDDLITKHEDDVNIKK